VQPRVSHLMKARNVLGGLGSLVCCTVVTPGCKIPVCCEQRPDGCASCTTGRGRGWDPEELTYIGVSYGTTTTRKSAHAVRYRDMCITRVPLARPDTCNYDSRCCRLLIFRVGRAGASWLRWHCWTSSSRASWLRWYC
jgi:hypothetical protein